MFKKCFSLKILFIFLLLLCSTALLVKKPATKQQITLLTLSYHYVRDKKAPGPNCQPERLRQQLQFLRDNDYKIITCGEYANLKLFGTNLPGKVAILSFDDGLKDHYATAFPILKEFGARATFFLVTCVLNGEVPPVIGFQILIDQLGAKRIELEILPKTLAGTPYTTLLDPTRYDIKDAKSGEPPEMRRIKWIFNHFPSTAFKRDLIAKMFAEHLGDGAQKKIAAEWFLSPKEILEMAQNGMEIASHSHTHPPFDISGVNEIKWELDESKKQLTQLLGQTPRTFAYPFGGKYRPEIKAIALKYYASAWNYSGQAKIMPTPPYELGDMPRLNEKNFLIY